MPQPDPWSSLETWNEDATLSIQAARPSRDPVDEAPLDTGTPATPFGRFVDLGILGCGSMGEVHRVQDPPLQRIVALKILHPAGGPSEGARTRFLEEARATAQLQHPSIVPLFEIGELPDGRLYYTMREVQGITLQSALRSLHAGDPTRWRLRHLVEALHTAALAVGHAHRQGFVHRDIKPSNLMLGELGEVYVVDWGIACRFPIPPEVDPDTHETISLVIGTPSYMSPEQAVGDQARMGPPSDVYSLGATLFELLAGTPPYVGKSARHVLRAVQAGSIRPLEGRLPIPPGLASICQTAMQRDPTQRPADGVALAQLLQSWLHGETQREKGLDAVARADALLEKAAAERARAEARLATAEGLRAPLPPWAGPEDLRPAWAEEAAAEQATHAAAVLEIEAEAELVQALTHDPALEEAQSRFVGLRRSRLLRAEERRDAAEAARQRTLLESMARPDARGWLHSEARLTLITRPPGARALLSPLQERDQQRVVASTLDLGATPLVEVALAPGAYLLRLEHPDCSPTILHLHLGRGERLRGLGPPEDPSAPLPLPPSRLLRAEEVYIPPGWATLGGDPLARPVRPALRRWVPGFLLHRRPVTNGELLAFIQELALRDRAEEALRHTPRVEGAYPWDPALPATGVDLFTARAYASWRARQEGVPLRLPHESEWEKAARGVDGRYFPWGDAFEPHLCHMRDSRPGTPAPAPPGFAAADRSPYGVMDLAGGVATWCLPDPEEAARATAPDRAPIRGGQWNGDAWRCRAASRSLLPNTARDAGLGLRLARTWSG